ncbi:fibronectin type III domain-containing protein [Butyricicoccus pullicaecorum]|uniref:fibronectin type III domain-containing protein n=1 Tax=Butyricicoccus pullicaecorum TaxID=501571 RepID=UPI00039BA229|nr:fibronectin type III domain-containing protein [Butyricicoccus pullicaecorum]
MPVSISIPDTIRGGEDAKVSWPAATDPDGNLDGYIVERSYNGGSSWSQIYQGRETSTTTMIPLGTETVMFRVCAYDTAGAKSGWRTSENRTVINNRAPAAPPSISVPLKPAGGEKLTVTWTASTDADGNLEGYELERQWDGTGAFTQIYKGTGLSYQDSIPKGEHTSVVYRVRAYDSFASYSSYTTSPSRTIDNNTAPVIECSQSGDLGEKSEGFSIQYTIKDAEKQEVTVTEKVGDMVKRTYKATLDEQATFEITDEYFQKILNGAQTVQIVATDSAGKSSTLELTFTKAVHKAVITLEEPLAVEEQITVAVLAITGKIPADATQLIELTNNGNDPEPVWEDATADVKAGRNHPFTNKTQTNGWAFNFRVTVERGESGEDGNIVSIQGGFQ